MIFIMEKELSKLLDFRPSIKVLDATMRDGGLVNDFFFTDDFVKKLYQTNLKAGVDYMELGYKADKELFDSSKYGKWKFCDDDEIRKVLGDTKDSPLKLACMADVGRCNYKENIIKKDDSPLDMIRVATYLNTMPTAVEMIEDAKNKGYEVCCNIMAVSSAQESDIKVALELLGKSSVDVIYIVDSYGSIYPEAMARIADVYMSCAEKYGKKIGIHAHNNLQLAFANTIECVGDGVDFLDATYNGMGRGAGNCSMELLLGFLKNPKYKTYPVIQFIENEINHLKNKGTIWGYDLQYMMTGQLNQHPRSAIAFTKDGRSDYSEFYRQIVAEDLYKKFIT